MTVGCCLGGVHWVPFNLARRCIIPNQLGLMLDRCPQLAFTIIGMEIAATIVTAFAPAYMHLLDLMRTPPAPS